MGGHSGQLVQNVAGDQKHNSPLQYLLLQIPDLHIIFDDQYFLSFHSVFPLCSAPDNGKPDDGIPDIPRRMRRSDNAPPAGSAGAALRLQK